MMPVIRRWILDPRDCRIIPAGEEQEKEAEPPPERRPFTDDHTVTVDGAAAAERFYGPQRGDW